MKGVFLGLVIWRFSVVEGGFWFVGIKSFVLFGVCCGEVILVSVICLFRVFRWRMRVLTLFKKDSVF